MKKVFADKDLNIAYNKGFQEGQQEIIDEIRDKLIIDKRKGTLSTITEEFVLWNYVEQVLTELKSPQGLEQTGSDITASNKKSMYVDNPTDIQTQFENLIKQSIIDAKKNIKINQKGIELNDSNLEFHRWNKSANNCFLKLLEDVELKLQSPQTSSAGDRRVSPMGSRSLKGSPVDTNRIMQEGKSPSVLIKSKKGWGRSYGLNVEEAKGK